MSAAPAGLRVSAVRKRFQGVIAVDGVSFTAPPGRVTGLIGPNGSGKTTTMNVITGLCAPDAGEVLLDDAPLGALKPFEIARRGVARTFQNIRLLPDATALDNVIVGAIAAQKAALLASLARLPSARREEAAARALAQAMLERVGAGALADRPAGALSYGDRRRVEIARALATRPRLLLLDEPAAGMTHAERRALAVLIRSIREEGVTVLLVEHDSDLVAAVCDHVVALNFGRVIAAGAPAEIREDPAVIEAYLGTDDDA
ncbi:ABC transporter ATP-binding protein [Camelimonas abortus]|uniref:ABC transporter ATP-binding protein n=1 Tax=Camelimonas abortus TaxID=1017184 RepID=A0ABV7LG95_9HYPH